jgi:DtxR family Mn-dependent transcriptional regulator
MSLEIGPSPEMYLKTMDELDAGARPVSIASVAERMGVTTVSANEMVHRLEQQKLVHHRRYRGVSLTASGRRYARALIRRHRLWEWFLYHELGLAWESVHDLACELEHAAPDAVTEALDRRMGHPVRCPHGNPIPALDGSEAPLSETRLADLGEDERGVVVAVHPESTEILSYLAGQGLLPGNEFHISRVEPTDGIRLLEVGEHIVPVGPELAGRVRVGRAE